MLRKADRNQLRRVRLKKNLHGYFTETSFYIDTCDGLEDLYKSFSNKFEGLFHLAFKEKDCLSPALIFLHDLSSLFIRRLSQQPDLEISIENIEFLLNLKMLTCFLKSCL